MPPNDGSAAARPSEQHEKDALSSQPETQTGRYPVNAHIHSSSDAADSLSRRSSHPAMQTAQSILGRRFF